MNEKCPLNFEKMSIGFKVPVKSDTYLSELGR